MTNADRGFFASLATIILWLTIIFIASFVLGCGPHYDGTWTVTGDATPAYRQEIAIAAEVIRAQEGVLHREWGGTVEVLPAPFACGSPTGFCAGEESGDHHVRVAYDEAMGLGPAAGTTALEHELCHAARNLYTCGFTSACDGGDETKADECAARAMPEIERRLAP